jgi:hypothetical protein
MTSAMRERPRPSAAAGTGGLGAVIAVPLATRLETALPVAGRDAMMRRLKHVGSPARRGRD